MEGLIRQGDVLLTPVTDRHIAADVRQKGKTIKRVRGLGLVLAEGEATDHHHVVRTKGAKLIERGGVLYLHVPTGGAELEHLTGTSGEETKDHESLDVPRSETGLLRVGGQREYVAPTRSQSAPSTRRVYD